MVKRIRRNPVTNWVEVDYRLVHNSPHYDAKDVGRAFFGRTRHSRAGQSISVTVPALTPCRRMKVVASGGGERDVVKRMRLWFGGSSVAEVELMLRQRLLAMRPDGFPYWSGLKSSLRRTLFFDQTSWLVDDLLE